MPYIRGRYYMNPVVGDALEAAREAEAALQALEHAAKVARGDTGDEDAASAGSSSGRSDSSSASSGSNSSADAYAKSAPGPIHRVEIEAAELVPAHSGRRPARFRSPHPSPRQWQRRKRARAGRVPRPLKFVIVNSKRKRERIRLHFAVRAQFLDETKCNAPRPRNPRLLQSQRPYQFPPRPILRRLQVAHVLL